MVKEVNQLPSAVEKQLECPVCLLKFRTPKLLECMHTFCQECLLNLAKHSRLGGLVIRCPTCRQKTKVVDVTKLHNNFIVQGIIDSLADTAENKNTLSPHHINSKTVNIKSSKANEPFSFSGCLLSNVNSIPSTPDSTNIRNIGFSFAPSYDFGDLSTTSFNQRRTSMETSNNNNTQHNDSGFDFSPFVYSSPAISFQSSIDKTSFSPLLFHMPKFRNQDNSGQFKLVRPSPKVFDMATKNADSSYFSPNFIVGNLSWGSFEKTSFAS